MIFCMEGDIGLDFQHVSQKWDPYVFLDDIYTSRKYHVAIHDVSRPQPRENNHIHNNNMLVDVSNLENFKKSKHFVWSEWWHFFYIF